MADRYPMLPNAFPPGIVQQHQQQMGQAQHLQQLQQQDSHPQASAFADQGPMWQMQQIQNQFRPQSTGMDPAHVSPQASLASRGAPRDRPYVSAH